MLREASCGPGEMVTDWSAERLERLLRKGVKERQLSVQKGALSPSDCSAKASFNLGDKRKKKVITLDRFQVADLNGLIHELIEIYLNDELDRWGDLRETVVVALEMAIVERILSEPRRTAWWRRVVRKRLA